VCSTCFGLKWQNLQGYSSIIEKYSLDDMIMGNEFGNTQVSFGDTPKKVTNEGNAHNDH
jgi:hypothetical protein